MSDASIAGIFAWRGPRRLGAGLKLVYASVGVVKPWPSLFLGVAFWNGFPLMFYDTGAYLEQGLSGAFLVERSPVYSPFCCGSPVAVSACGRW